MDVEQPSLPPVPTKQSKPMLLREGVVDNGGVTKVSSRSELSQGSTRSGSFSQGSARSGFSSNPNSVSSRSPQSQALASLAEARAPQQPPQQPTIRQPTLSPGLNKQRQDAPQAAKAAKAKAILDSAHSPQMAPRESLGKKRVPSELQRYPESQRSHSQPATPQAFRQNNQRGNVRSVSGPPNPRRR